jgi:hypothetical protein
MLDVNDSILLKLVLAGVKPAVSDHFMDHWTTLVEKYPDKLAIANVYHESRLTPVLYNKKYKKLVFACQDVKDNQKNFGKLMGYTYLYDLRKLLQSGDDVTMIEFYIGNEKIWFIGYYRPINSTLTKDYKLLKRMQAVDKNISIKIRFTSP